VAPLLTLFKKHQPRIIIGACAAVCLILAVIIIIGLTKNTQTSDEHRRLITVYDRGVQSAFLSDAKTLGQALQSKGVTLDAHDAVEPAVTEELVAPSYQVTIYRARPVTVIDGATKVKIMTAYQTAARIAHDAGIGLYPEDATKVSRSLDFTGEGAGLQLTITRAVPLFLDLYGKTTEIRTQGKTVQEMLNEKGIVLGDKGRVSVPLTTPIVDAMNVRVWREGKQTVSVDQVVPFETERIYDADRLIGYREVTVAGKNGIRSINYEVNIKEGAEISRQEIAQIVTLAPVKQVEVVGIKSLPGALTKSKGAQYFTDSKGVSHRETYYDLDMSVVMQACGQGGRYTIRVDGVKVDADGYAIIAANYGRYPRCSVVETSVGPGKVYDTGGFAARYPDGFDISTDWTTADGI
jgi:uncharacterized protein YabE (DUF348 family)